MHYLLANLRWNKFFVCICWQKPVEPASSARGVHGKAGTSFVCLHDGLVYSAGRDGTYRQYSLSQTGELILENAFKVCAINAGSCWDNRTFQQITLDTWLHVLWLTILIMLALMFLKSLLGHNVYICFDNNAIISCKMISSFREIIILHAQNSFLSVELY